MNMDINLREPCAKRESNPRTDPVQPNEYKDDMSNLGLPLPYSRFEYTCKSADKPYHVYCISKFTLVMM
jgi:hypothetical protein